MAYRAGARVINAEFIQFHPTTFFDLDAPRFLISEAVRGEGARLVHANGEPFMQRYDVQWKDLAPRDVVARSIHHEMLLRGVPSVYLDLRSYVPRARILEHFPTIHRDCLAHGIDITRDLVPVVPAAHYACGGVWVDPWGRTTIDGLYAVGEVACTGVHGANRLASNSLLEALVCAHRAALKTGSNDFGKSAIAIPPWHAGNAGNPDEMVVVSHNWDEIRRLMWDYVGIVRTTKRLRRAEKRIVNLQQEIQEYYWDFLVTSDLLELRNIATVAELIIRSALSRPESRGLHYNLDYPNADPAWAQRDTVLRREL
jgi:L-aspartate oxidase